MRTTLGTLVKVMIMAAALGTGSTAFALDDAAGLRCDATVAKSQSRLFGCVAKCQETAAKLGLGVLGYDEARCSDRCDRRYQHALRSPQCAGGIAERMPASELAGVDAETLRCREAAATLESRVLLCLANCAESAEFAARRGSTVDSEACIDMCADRDAMDAARAEARSGCVLGAAVE